MRLSVLILRGHLFFPIPAKWPMTSDFER